MRFVSSRRMLVCRRVIGDLASCVAGTERRNVDEFAQADGCSLVAGSPAFPKKPGFFSALNRQANDAP